MVPQLAKPAHTADNLATCGLKPHSCSRTCNKDSWDSLQAIMPVIRFTARQGLKLETAKGGAVRAVCPASSGLAPSWDRRVTTRTQGCPPGSPAKLQGAADGGCDGADGHGADRGHLIGHKDNHRSYGKGHTTLGGEGAVPFHPSATLSSQTLPKDKKQRPGLLPKMLCCFRVKCRSFLQSPSVHTTPRVGPKAKKAT